MGPSTIIGAEIMGGKESAPGAELRGSEMTAAVSELLTWLTAGSAPAALVKVVVAACALVLGLVYRRYRAILGANRSVPAERQAYDALRNSLARGNLAARLYADQLTRFLDWIDRFFGDAGMAERTLFPHAFGLRTPAPLWTAPALDRCLLLALLYPVAAIFVIWAVSGHVGPAEAALRLKPDIAWWQRGLAVAGAILCVVGALRVGTTQSIPSIGLILLGAAATSFAGIPAVVLVLVFALGVPSARVGSSNRTGLIGVAGVFAGAITGAAIAIVADATIAVTAAVTSTIGIVVSIYVLRTEVGGVINLLATITALTSGGALAGAAFGGVAGAVVGSLGDAVAGAGIGAAAFAVTTLVCFEMGSIVKTVYTDERPGIVILVCFLTLMLIVSLSAAYWLAHSNVWRDAGPILMFLGLLTALNTPFDWISLGLTRALLRRGLELGGWWPYALALADATLAAVIIVALALTMVIGVQAFDALAVHGGGTSVLALEPLFTGITAHPSAPEYWWLYALLLSTMIPSLVNLVVGGASLVRGVPALPTLLLRKIPARGNVPKFDRAWIATVLTGQVAVGAALGIAAQAFLVMVIIGYIMPWIGADLLDMARDVAAFNLPARVGQLFGVSL
jgi:hypothetical protein